MKSYDGTKFAGCKIVHVTTTRRPLVPKVGMPPPPSTPIQRTPPALTERAPPSSKVWHRVFNTPRLGPKAHKKVASFSLSLALPPSLSFSPSVCFTCHRTHDMYAVDRTIFRLTCMQLFSEFNGRTGSRGYVHVHHTLSPFAGHPNLLLCITSIIHPTKRQLLQYAPNTNYAYAHSVCTQRPPAATRRLNRSPGNTNE